MSEYISHKSNITNEVLCLELAFVILQEIFIFHIKSV